MVQPATCTFVLSVCLALSLLAEVGAVPRQPVASPPGERTPNEMKDYFGALLPVSEHCVGVSVQHTKRCMLRGTM